MQTELHSCYFTKKGPELITLFGYSTKSVPGLEINGIGKYGKGIKEKIIFITRSRNLPIPIKRFVLNVEFTDELGEIEGSALRFIEFPLLIHYWFLAGLLPISKLDNCFAIGSLTPSGVVEEPESSQIGELCKKSELNLISARGGLEFRNLIDGRDLLSSLPELEFRSKVFEQESYIQ